MRAASTLMRELVGRMGLAAVTEAIDDLLAYTARRLRNRIARHGGRRSRASPRISTMTASAAIRCRSAPRVIVRGDTLTVDFAGTGAGDARRVQRAGQRAACHVYYAVKALLDPELLPNSGMFDCIEIRAEPGTLVNPRFPAAVGARSITCNKIARALFGAFADAAAAASAPWRRRMTACRRSSSPARAAAGDGSFVYLETHRRRHGRAAATPTAWKRSTCT